MRDRENTVIDDNELTIHSLQDTLKKIKDKKLTVRVAISNIETQSHLVTFPVMEVSQLLDDDFLVLEIDWKQVLKQINTIANSLREKRQPTKTKIH
jgi:hypothetical protein